MRRTAALLVPLTLVALTSSGQGAEYFVAPGGTSDNPGTRELPWSLARANDALQPGDTALLLEGVYTGTPVAPVRSGQEGRPIAYRADVQHRATFRDVAAVPGSQEPAAVILNDRSYIEIDGISAAGLKRWVTGANCSHITIANCQFERGTGWINCRFEESGDGLRLTGNAFHGGTDLVSIDGGDGHLVQNNDFGDATHTSLVLLGVQRSVVRGNRLTNRRWRCMEVESQRHEPFRISEHNVIEGNVFGYTPCAAIQYAGNRSILRRNVFRRCLTGMNWASYLGSNKGRKVRTPEAWHNESNRFHNNTIAYCGANRVVLELIAQARAAGISVAYGRPRSGYAMMFATDLLNPRAPECSDCAYGDNVATNNILYLNGNDTEFTDRQGRMAAATAHIAFDWNATPEFGSLQSNVIYSGEVGAEAIYFCDAAYLEPPEPRNLSVAAFQDRYPRYAKANVDVDPGFVDPDAGDFRLRSDSPCIDAGAPLTRAASAGRGTAIQVEDALYFSDGYGIVAPDTVRVGSHRVGVVRVDYTTNTLWLDRRLSWEQGTPVAPDYNGTAPDMGAFEAP